MKRYTAASAVLGSLAIADILADLTYFALNSVVYSVKLLNHTAVWAWLPQISLLSTPLQHILDTRLRRVCSAVSSVRPYVQNRHIFDAVKEEEIWPSPYTVGHPSIMVDFSLYCN